MKFLPVLLLLVSTSVMAEEPNWINILTFAAFNGGNATSYLDDANPVQEGTYGGFAIKNVFENLVVDNQNHTTWKAIIELFEFDCHTKQGRAKPIIMIDVDGKGHNVTGAEWYPITNAPATDIMKQVERRTCFYALPGSNIGDR